MSLELSYVEKLSAVSTTAHDVISRALYLGSNPNPSGNDVLAISLQCANADLMDIGFFRSGDLIGEDPIKSAKEIGTLLSTFRPTFFNDLLKREPKVLDSLEKFDFLGFESPSEVLPTFIQKLLRHFPNNAQLKATYKVLQNSEYTYNTTFIKYLQRLVDEVEEESSVDLVENLDLIKELIHVTTNNRSLYKEAVDKVLNSFEDRLSVSYLKDSIENYDLDKLRAGEVNKFSWAVVTKKEDLSEVEQKYQASIIDEHKKSNRHHMEYYIAHPKVIIGFDQIVELVCHHFEYGATEEDTLTDTIEMFTEDSKNENLISREGILFAKEILELLLEDTLQKDIDDAFTFLLE